MRLTDRVLFGLIDGLDRGLAELAAIADESPEYEEEYQRATDAKHWAIGEAIRRARKDHMTYVDWVNRQRVLSEQRIQRAPGRYTASVEL